MRISNLAGCTLSTSMALTALAGCGGSTQTAPTLLGLAPGPETQSTPWQRVQDSRLRIRALLGSFAPGRPNTTGSFMNPDARGKPLIFAANAGGSCGFGYVDIYLQGGKNKLVGQITGLCGASGVAADAARNLYVADEGHSAVPVYAPPYTGAPALTLDDTGELPQNVAVSRKGVVGVSNICSAPSCGGSGSVTFYAKNSTTPCVTVTDPNFYVYPGDGFDKKGNLYIDGVGGPPSYSFTIAEIKGGCHAKKIMLLTTTNTLGSLGDIQIDKAGRIAVQDYHNSGDDVIDTYNPPSQGSLGSPVSSVSLGLLVYSFTFRGSGAEIYVGARNNSSNYEVVSFGYPGGAEIKAFNAGGGTGMAATPALIP
jgi:hypothetical protein